MQTYWLLLFQTKNKCSEQVAQGTFLEAKGFIACVLFFFLMCESDLSDFSAPGEKWVYLTLLATALLNPSDFTKMNDTKKSLNCIDKDKNLISL